MSRHALARSMLRNAGSRAVPAIALLSAGLLAACASGPAATAVPAGTAVGTAATTAAATLEPTKAPNETARPIAIADGTYVTKPLAVAAFRAAIDADAKLTDDEKATIINSLFELDGHTTIAVKLMLSSGSWTQFSAFDGGAFRVGSRATYAFPDATTVVISEQCCGVTTFTVTPDRDGFRLQRVTGTQNGELDVITGKLLFESAAFQPGA
jgi:hypothetical protein